MKLAIISAEKQFEIERIKEETEKKKHEVFVFHPQNLQAEISKKKFLTLCYSVFCRELPCSQEH